MGKTARRLDDDEGKDVILLIEILQQIILIKEMRKRSAIRKQIL